MTSGKCHYCLKSFSCLKSKQVCCQHGKIPQGLVHYGETFKKGRIVCPFLPLAIPPPPTHTHRTSTTHTGERQIWDWQQWFQCLFLLCLFSFNLLHSTDPHILDCAVQSWFYAAVVQCMCVCVCVWGGGVHACMHLEWSLRTRFCAL